MASISGYLALGFCFLTLGAGMAAFINKSNVHQYLENHKSELGDQHVETIETWYITVGVCMFVVSALQMIRYCLSSRFVRSADRLDDAYIILIDDDGDEVREEQNRNATTSKFKNMRNQYADKYAKMENESKEQWQSRN